MQLHWVHRKGKKLPYTQEDSVQCLTSMQLALRFHTSVLSIALIFRNPEMSPEESVFQFQQIQKKEMIYFVLGLSISVSTNKKTEKKMIFIFF